MARRKHKVKKQVELGWPEVRAALIGLLYRVWSLLKAAFRLMNPINYIRSQRKPPFKVDHDGSVIHRPTLWERIMRFFCRDPDVSNRRRLLQWVQMRLPDFNVYNFSSCWSDGIAICALVENLCPGACPRPDLLRPQHKVNNCRLGIKLANKHLGIPMTVITPEEMALHGPHSEPKMRQLLSIIKWASDQKKTAFAATREKLSQMRRVSNIVQQAQVCSVKGVGLAIGIVGKRCRFNIHTPTLSIINITIDIRGPTGSYCHEKITSLFFGRKNSIIAEETPSCDEHVPQENQRRASDPENWKIPFDYQCLEEGNLLISYVPRFVGTHVISIQWHNTHVKGSPFTSNIVENVAKLNQIQGARGRITQLQMTKGALTHCTETDAVADDGPTSSRSTLDNIQHEDRLAVAGKTWPHGARLTKQATVTRRRVLRRIITKAGQEIVIQEVPSSDPQSKNTSTEGSGQNQPPNRSGSPVPQPKRSNSSDFDVSYDSDDTCVSKDVMKKKKDTAASQSCVKTKYPKSLKQLAANVAKEIVSKAVKTTSNPTKSSASPVKWRFHSEPQKVFQSDKPKAHGRLHTVSSIPLQIQKNLLCVPKTPDHFNGSPFTHKQNKENGKSKLHRTTPKFINETKWMSGDPDCSKDKPKPRRKLYGTLSEPLGATDKVRNWLLLPHLEGPTKENPEGEDPSSDKHDTCEGNFNIEAKTSSPYSMKTDPQVEAKQIENSRESCLDCVKSTAEIEPQLKVQTSHSDPSQVQENVSSTVEPCSSLSLDTCVNDNAQHTDKEETRLKLLQSQSLKKSCFYISQKGQEDSALSRNGVDTVKAKEPLDGNQSVVSTMDSEEPLANLSHAPGDESIKSKLRSRPANSLSISRSLPILSKNWTAFEFDPDDDISKLDKTEPVPIMHKRLSLGGRDHAEKIAATSLLASFQMSKNLNGSISNPVSLKNVKNTNEPATENTNAGSRLSNFNQISKMSENDDVINNKTSNLLKETVGVGISVKIIDRVDTEASSQSEIKDKRPPVTVPKDSVTSISIASISVQTSDQNTQADKADIEKETGWIRPTVYLKRRRQVVKIFKSVDEKQRSGTEPCTRVLYPSLHVTSRGHGNEDMMQNNDALLRHQLARQSTVDTVDSGIADDQTIPPVRPTSRPYTRFLNGHRIVARRPYRGKISLDPRLFQASLSSGEDREKSREKRPKRRLDSRRSQKNSLSKEESTDNDGRSNTRKMKSKTGRRRRVLFSRRVMMYRRSSSSRSSRHSKEFGASTLSQSIQGEVFAPLEERLDSVEKGFQIKARGFQRESNERPAFINFVSNKLVGPTDDSDEQVQMKSVILSNGIDNQRLDSRLLNINAERQKESGCLHEDVNTFIPISPALTSQEEDMNFSFVIKHPKTDLPLGSPLGLLSADSVGTAIDLPYELDTPLESMPDFARMALGPDYVSLTGLLDKNYIEHRHEPINQTWENSSHMSVRDSPVSPTDPVQVQVFGQNLYYGFVGARNLFQVWTEHAGNGSLTVGVLGPRQHTVKSTAVTYTGDNLYDVEYDVTQPGYYVITVKWADVLVQGCPFIAKVTY